MKLEMNTSRVQELKERFLGYLTDRINDVTNREDSARRHENIRDCYHYRAKRWAYYDAEDTFRKLVDELLYDVNNPSE
jgi:hypothetical protein